MFKNYLIVALRNMMRHKGYSAINIAGLAAGMACCILVLLFVQDEFQYDAYHKDADRIYRLIASTKSQDGTVSIREGVSGPLAPEMAEAFPEVEATARVWMAFVNYWFRVGDQIGVEKFCLADPHIFEFFSFVLLKGDAKTALREPFTAVISESMARKYFKDEDPIGQTVTVEARYLDGEYRVTGVMQDLPAHSTLQMDFITSTVRGWEPTRIWNMWFETASWQPLWTFVRLREGASPALLAEKLPDLVKRKHRENPQAAAEVPKGEFELWYDLQPLKEMRLYSTSNYGLANMGLGRTTTLELYGDIQRVYLLSAVAVFVLAIACINFMNLTTARSVGRAREVGLRKVVGADRGGLVQQFLGESIVMAMLALVVAVGLVIVVLPTFNGFLGKTLSLWAGGQVVWFMGLLGLAVFVGLLAGSYPAFYLSAFEPVDVLKGSFQGGGRGVFLRKALVVIQFALSILLIIGTAVVYRQLAYMQDKDLGFEKEQVVFLPIFHLNTQLGGPWPERLVFRFQTVKQAFMAHPNITGATISRYVTGRSGGHVRVRYPEGFDNPIRWQQQPVDENFIDFFGLELIEGRAFFPEDMFRGEKYILNEAAVEMLGWSNPIGKKIVLRDTFSTVVGVVKNFHHGSQHAKIGPAVLIPANHLVRYLVLRVQPDHFSETLAFMQKTWHAFLPQRPFEFAFLDESLNNLYDAEQRIGKATGVFAVVAIGLACLGLFGLAAFTTEQRTKEIGVRKVMGASVGQLVLLLSKEFAQLVVVANIVAWPVAYYALNAWLRGFAYRTTLGVDVFILGGGLAVLIAFLTVSTLSIRAAQKNPVDALRYE